MRSEMGRVDVIMYLATKQTDDNVEISPIILPILFGQFLLNGIVNAYSFPRLIK